MTNATLKARIERKANCRVKLSSYKCSGWEGTATAVDEAGKTITFVTAYNNRTRSEAHFYGMLKLADRLRVPYTDEEANSKDRAADAEFGVRTRRNG